MDETTDERKERPTDPTSSWDQIPLRQLRWKVRQQASKKNSADHEMRFPVEPQNPERRALITQLFREEGITVVWRTDENHRSL